MQNHTVLAVPSSTHHESRLPQPSGKLQSHSSITHLRANTSKDVTEDKLSVRGRSITPTKSDRSMSSPRKEKVVKLKPLNKAGADKDKRDTLIMRDTELRKLEGH